MSRNDFLLGSELNHLWEQLKELHEKLRNHTSTTYGRINPFTENLFEWKEKGSFVGGRNVTIYDSTYISGKVTIGDDTWIGPFCALDGVGGLTIGRSCSISSGSYILTHDTIKWALSGGRQPYEYRPVSVGDYCFIGVNTVITPGVTIGNRCLVGAGSVVTSDIPDCSIAAGNPARVIGRVTVGDDGAIILEYDTEQGS